MAFDAVARCGAGRFRENLLFYPRGLSGPVILQVSSTGRHGTMAAGPRRQPDHCQSLPGRKRPPVADGACPQQDAARQPALRPSAQTLRPRLVRAARLEQTDQPVQWQELDAIAAALAELDHYAQRHPRLRQAEVTLGGVIRGRCRRRPWSRGTSRGSTSSAGDGCHRPPGRLQLPVGLGRQPLAAGQAV